MSQERPFTDRLLDHLDVTYRVAERDLARIPRKSPVVVVVNHPFGIPEGAVLATVLARVRPDVKFLANGILCLIPEVRDLLIPVDPLRSTQSNRSGLWQSIELLRLGGLLVVFFAGAVSHFQWRRHGITDPERNPAIARMIEIAARRGVAPAVMPVFVNGSNSALFQIAGLLHPRLRTALLARELLNKRRQVVELRIGSPIPGEKLLAIPSDKERTEYLRWRTYLLANRQEYKAQTSLPWSGPPAGHAGIRAGVFRRMPARTPAWQARGPLHPSEELAHEIGSISPDLLLARSGDLGVYLAPAERIPKLLAEIGRLREITFRAAGEGTGRPTDLDHFDAHYLHLFVWNANAKEIVGAYRLVGTEVGTKNLYTPTRFKYGDAFLAKMGPALELGRSFVRPEYQKGFAPLLLLWKGIGKYVAQNPKYKTLFGPVSISNQYKSISRELMITFLERHASLREWLGLVSNRNPFRRRRAVKPAFPSSGFDIEDLSDVVTDLEASRAGVPVLLRQYLRLGGKLLGFNVDPEFADALDGLILVDLTRTEPNLLDRYLGKTEAAQFLVFQKGSHATQ